MAGANPFLMMEEEFGSSAPAANSNPFLMDDMSFPDANSVPENPFLFEATVPTTNGTNPFAFDPAPVTTTSGTDSFFGTPNVPNDLFGAVEKPCGVSNDLFSADNEVFTNNQLIFTEPSPVKPDNLELKHTNTVKKVEDVSNVYSSDEEMAKMPPRRPPPPRPNIPPSKETQDLIMSVMGAMDATSTHLLDRIPPTRTPSPVSIRDLHSPSPTPEHAFADFLDVGDGGKQNQPQGNADVNLLDVSDVQQAPTMQPIQPEQSMQPVQPIQPIQSVQPIQPMQSVQPMQPVQPVNKVNNTDPFMGLMGDNTECDINQNHSMQQNGAPPRPQPPRPQPPRPQPPQKPPPPVLKPHAEPIPEPDSKDDFLLGEPTKPQEKHPASTADIMSLYSAQPAKPEPIDLLCNDSNDLNPQGSTNDIISPSLSQHDIHMDTSDTQSKGSGSSATFNPFTSEETIVPAMLDSNSPVKTQELISQDNFLSGDQQDVFGHQPTDPNCQSTDVFNLQADISHNQPADVFNQPPTDVFHQQPTDSFNQKPDIFSQPQSDAFSQPQTNIFNQPETDIFSQPQADSFSNPQTDAFAQPQPDAFNQPQTDAFSQPQPDSFNRPSNIFNQQQTDEFDAFAAKFDSVVKENGKSYDPFSGGAAWGDIENDNVGASNGFEADEPFDAFLSMQAPPAVPQGTPAMLSKRESQESDEDKDFSVFIKPKNADDTGMFDASMPVLAPPPSGPVQNAFTDTSPRFNPFDQQNEVGQMTNQIGALPFDAVIPQMERTDSQETPPTPLFDDDVSQPLEVYPRVEYFGDGWEMQLRQPNKKKITGQRFWKKIFVRLVVQEGCPILQLSNTPQDKDPFQELPLQPCYSVSEIGAQQYDNYGKIFTIKLQYVFYKERPGVRPGQVTKAERITNKLSQFAAYAIQGDYQGVKEFGSDLKKLGLPVEHAPQVSQLLKLGSLNYEDLKQFSVCIEEALFRLSAHRDRALHYKMEEVQVTAVDELYVEQNAEGHVEKQIARVRLFFLGFLTGMPDVELGVNDMRRQGKEIVGRHDIIPVVTEEWIRIEANEFHACVQQEEWENTHIIKFKPPDACYIELMRFRIRPPKNRELPLQLKPVMCITGNKVELKADVLVPGFASRKLGQVPCEDVMIRFPIPECWIYLFRVEKHFRYGSVKSTHRRTGKIKGIERFLGTVETLQESLIEVTSGQAKYEHQHRAIVWRIPRLPKEGQGAYTTHNLVCRMALTSYDQVPDHLAEYAYVEFTMPATQASHTTIRSVSLQNSQSDDPPEKYVRYLARHEYRVGIEHTEGEEPGAYSAATAVSRQAPAPVPEEPAPAPSHAPDADSSSDSD